MIWASREKAGDRASKVRGPTGKESLKKFS